jgi:hypothetical protein
LPLLLLHYFSFRVSPFPHRLETSFSIKVTYKYTHAEQGRLLALGLMTATGASDQRSLDQTGYVLPHRFHELKRAYIASLMAEKKSAASAGDLLSLSKGKKPPAAEQLLDWLRREGVCHFLLLIHFFSACFHQNILVLKLLHSGSGIV